MPTNRPENASPTWERLNPWMVRNTNGNAPKTAERQPRSTKGCIELTKVQDAK
jgi:hypothetical protein